MIDRRACERVVVDVQVRAAAAPEMPLPHASAVNLSSCGLLISFAEPVGVLPGNRMVLSLQLPERDLHLISEVVRHARGTDFRSYVAVKFVKLDEEDTLLLQRYVEAVATPTAD